MFPLGPREDAKGILEHLGGSLDDDDQQSRWPATLRKGFRRLLGIGAPRGTTDQWDVLAFRILISPFYLRRGHGSLWNRSWVIGGNRTTKLIPRMVLPNKDAFSQLSDPKAKGKEVQQARATMTQKMQRADHKRFLAWSLVYEKIHDEYGDAAFAGAKYLKQMEQYVANYLRQERASGRITKLISLLKAHVEMGEKFIVVSDRLFLVILAYYICANVMGLKMGVLAGTSIFGHKPNETARDAVVNGINLGDLDSLVMTDRVGGCGHNMTGANVMIFLGSLYSHPYEEQVIARIDRPGQEKVPKVYIIADPEFEGDRMAFEIKNARHFEGGLMNAKFDKRKGHYDSLAMIDALLGSDEEWNDWQRVQREKQKKEEERLLKARMAAIVAVKRH